MRKYMADLLSNLDPHIKAIGKWDDCGGHYRYNTMEQVTPDDAMRHTESSGFWKSYAATIDSSTKDPLPCTDVTLNKPPQRASTISGTSKSFPVFEGINELKKKLAEIDVERNKYSSQQQKIEDDVSTLTQSMHKMASDIIYLQRHARTQHTNEGNH
jgi:hypothetical protein